MFITGGKETRQWKAHTVMHQGFSSGNEFLQKSQKDEHDKYGAKDVDDDARKGDEAVGK